MAKIITVIGATGAQGKGVVDAFLNNPAYTVRAITRNPSSQAAKGLAAHGAEVVSADLNDLERLKAAFAGSHIIFGVTNFFEPFAAHQSPTKAMEIEEQQGINMAKAAAATPTLEHYIWSTLPNIKAISGGKYLVPHFEGKNRIDAYIREKEPALLAKTTFLWVAFYATNLVFPMFTPYYIPTADKYLQFGSYAPETPIITIGDVTANIGLFAKAVVEQRDKTANGNIVLAATETRQAGELLHAWAQAQGKKAQFVRVSGEAFREIWPVWAEEMAGMMEFWDDLEFREKSWTEPSGQKVLTKEDLGVTGFKALEETYKALKL
ncbi:NAD(P)-binding protein [Parathielavia appendiculata]|uniref:NAD(P)-binding protein n=1 Tax=Parathielavia appendiculata TaxID=2587402 RepID=A0AAN6YZB9_9PEZI|nr:NAD(P)-binding protein [Parathielavia appendiculata]